MTIAELFVNLGVTGNGPTEKKLKSVKGILSDIADSSLAAKAGLVAALYGLEKLTGFASQTGLELKEFATVTGLSTDKIQELQHALMLYDVSGEETIGTIKNIQSAMMQMQMGQGAPEGLAQIMDAVGFDEKRVNDTFYVFSKLQEFIKKDPIAAHANQLTKSLSISDKMFTAMKMMNLERDKGNRLDYVTPKQIEQLANINRAWKEFFYQIKQLGTHFIASDTFGAFFKEMQDGAGLLIDFIKAIAKLVDHSTILKVVLGGVAAVVIAALSPVAELAVIITGIIAALGEIKKFFSGEAMFGGLISADSIKNFKESVKNGLSSLPGMSAFAAGDSAGQGVNAQAGMDMIRGINKPAEASQVNNNQNVTVQVDGANHPKAVADEIVKRVNEAALKMPARTGNY
jgi:hypothetical protein